jgi:hypothetical protein
MSSVPESVPHPFRFGLKALMLLIAVCGVQFALMSYLGPFFGLLVGLATCFLLLGSLMLTAMLFWRGQGTPLLHRLDQLAIRLVLGIVVLAIGSFLAGGGQIIYQELSAWRMASRLQNQLGFAATPQRIVDRNDMRWGLVVTSVSNGKPFDQAGVQAGDVIICQQDTRKFYEMLTEHRGEEVTLTVAAGADTSPLEKCVARRVDVSVPR